MCNRLSANERVGLLLLFLFFVLSSLVGCGQNKNHDPATPGIDGDTLRNLDAVLHADDLLDERLIQQRKDIVEKGEGIFPLLYDVLRKTDDGLVASRALSLLVSAKCPRKTIVGEIEILLARNTGDNEKMVQMRSIAIDFLGWIGTEAECTIIYPFVDDNRKSLRVDALHALGQIGGEEAVEKIEASLAQRGKGMSEVEIAKDPSFAEGAKAIERIRIRIGKQVSNEPSRKE